MFLLTANVLIISCNRTAYAKKTLYFLSNKDIELALYLLFMHYHTHYYIYK